MGKIDINFIKQLKDTKKGDKVLCVSRDDRLFTLVCEVFDIVEKEHYYTITIINNFEHIKIVSTCLPSATSFIVEDFIVFLDKNLAIEYLEHKILDIQDEISVIKALRI